MKVSGAIIQNRNIFQHTENDFHATYKGKTIFITTDHGHGDAKYDHLKRFDIDVRDDATGWLDVTTYEDHHTIKDAIRSALQGAMLIP